MRKTAFTLFLTIVGFLFSALEIAQSNPNPSYEIINNHIYEPSDIISLAMNNQYTQFNNEKLKNTIDLLIKEKKLDTTSLFESRIYSYKTNTNQNLVIEVDRSPSHWITRKITYIGKVDEIYLNLPLNSSATDFIDIAKNYIEIHSKDFIEYIFSRKSIIRIPIKNNTNYASFYFDYIPINNIQNHGWSLMKIQIETINPNKTNPVDIYKTTSLDITELESSYYLNNKNLNPQKLIMQQELESQISIDHIVCDKKQENKFYRVKFTLKHKNHMPYIDLGKLTYDKDNNIIVFTEKADKKIRNNFTKGNCKLKNFIVQTNSIKITLDITKERIKRYETGYSNNKDPYIDLYY